MNELQIIRIVITTLSLIDFVIFTLFFGFYILIVTFKSNSFSEKLGSLFVLLLFIVYKIIHIPVFLLNFPELGITFFDDWYIYFIGFLTWSNLILAIVPVILGVYTHIKNRIDVKIYYEPDINIIIPIYNEKPESLWKCIESIKKVNYDKNKINVFLSFDHDTLDNPSAFLFILDYFLIKLEDFQKFNEIKIVDENLTFFLLKLGHGGKKSAQKKGIEALKKYNSSDIVNDSLLFFIDSDIVLEEECIYSFLKTFQETGKNILTGLITCITSRTRNFLTMFQDIEYLQGQIFWRNLENYLGTTSCLPGAFTILKYSSFIQVEKEYFSKIEFKDIFEYQRFYLGEDRYLTHLLMEKEPWKVGFCSKARCKTEAPDNYNSFLKQRKRWNLAHISNETWMLSNINFWNIYPFLIIFNFINNARNTSIYIYLLYFTLIFNQNVNFLSWFLYVILPLICSWCLIIIYTLKYNKKMNIIFYIIILLFQPILNCVIFYYTLIMIREQSWGGPRDEKNSEVVV